MEAHQYQRRVVTRIERVDRDVVKRFQNFYSAIVLDAMGKYNIADVDLGPLNPGMRVVGPAVTSLGPDLTVRRMVIDLAQPGDVLVVDAAGLRALAFPTFCRGVTARNYHYPAGGDHGAVNVPVVVGGVLVEPGDLVVADDDGVVFVPRVLAADIADIVEPKLAAERQLRDSWTTYPSFDVADELRRRRYVFE
jgi:4-hydroxy-4-methyl-2-oxoglutarate aldolase